MQTTTEKTLSMTPSAIRSRERRAAAITKTVMDDVNTPVKKPAVRKATSQTNVLPKVSVAQKRTIGQVCASVAAGFLPVASFILAHYETKTNPLLWILVCAALMFSAPTLAEWAEKWTGKTKDKTSKDATKGVAGAPKAAGATTKPTASLFG